MPMSIPQQGSDFPFFSLTAYHYLANKDTSKFEVILEDIPNPEVRGFLAEVCMYIRIPKPDIGPTTLVLIHKHI